MLEFRDMQEFISDHARKKVSKLQRGSVEGFIKKNGAINALNVFDANRQTGIEEILQIRHLYSHRNGIIDDKFREHFPAATLHAEHQLSLKDFLQRFEYLAKAVDHVVLQAFLTPASVHNQLSSFVRLDAISAGPRRGFTRALPGDGSGTRGA